MVSIRNSTLAAMPWIAENQFPDTNASATFLSVSVYRKILDGA